MCTFKFSAMGGVKGVGAWGKGGGVLAEEHKVLTYVEYRAVPDVFQIIAPPPSPPSECVLSPHQRGLHTRRAVRGVGGQYFGRRQP